MKKSFLILLSLFISTPSFAVRPHNYILAVFHGLGSGKTFNEEQNLPQRVSSAGVVKMYNSGHDVSDRNLKEILKNFDCANGKQKNKDLGLVIIGYSWGARASYEFSKDYLEKCGQKAERAYMLDGVQKLISQFKHAPVAKVCNNYFKTLSPIRGRALEGCENHDMTDLCKNSDGSYGDSWECHGKVINRAMELVYEDMDQSLGLIDLDLFIQEI